MLFMFGIVPALCGPLLLLVVRDKLVQRSWRRSATQLELGFSAGPLMGGDRMDGTLSGHRVVITNELRRTTRVLLDASRAIPAEIQLSLKAWGFIRAEESLATGDEDFDRTVFATGPRAELLARLNSETRTIVRDAITAPPGRFTAQLEIANGWIIYTAPGVLVKMKNLKCIILTLVRVAEAMALHDSVPAALRDNACSTHEAASVRLKNLRALIEHYADSSETTDACRTALRARSWSLRLAGARYLDRSREGINTLLSIMRSPEAPPRARVRALRHLIGLQGRLPPDSDVIAISRAPTPELRVAAAEVLGLRRSDLAIDRLLEMVRDPRFEVVERVAAHLAAIPDERCERALIALLEHDMIEVRRAAARGLEQVGSVNAVEPLMASTRGVLTDIELKAIARRTIARIQGRLIGADTGHLSLAERDAQGSVSFARSEGGLSLKEG